VSATAIVPTTATVATSVAFAATCSPSGCGTATPAYSWDFGDGTAFSAQQNPSHIYADVGTYTWTLTVVVDTATTTKTGTITVSTAPSCIATTTSVLARPSPQTLDGMWQATGVPLAPGDVVTVTVGGGQTWTRGGQAWTADGNPADLTIGYNSPLPGGPRMALVGRVGLLGSSFLVGASFQFTAQASGQLYLAPNDDWYLLWNDAGSLTVSICR
jgi:PKD repeat protein